MPKRGILRPLAAPLGAARTAASRQSPRSLLKKSSRLIRKVVTTLSFAELQLDARLLQGIQKLGFNEPTPIQKEAIPPALAGRDVLACAKTGSGKTAAFALPILQRLAAKPRGGT